MTDIKLKCSTSQIGTSRIDLAETKTDHGYFATVWRDPDGEKGRRIIACWNACAGIDTASLESAVAEQAACSLPSQMEIQACETAHRELLDASREIGRVCEMASWASYEAAERVMASGKRVDDLTVRELRALTRAHYEESAA